MTRNRLSRRDVVRFVGLGVVGAGVAQLVAACGSTPSPTASAAAQKPAAPAPTSAPAATTAPAGAAATKPAAAATSAPAAAAPATGGKAITLNWITPAEPGLERDFYTGFIKDYQQQHPNV